MADHSSQLDQAAACLVLHLEGAALGWTSGMSCFPSCGCEPKPANRMIPKEPKVFIYCSRTKFFPLKKWFWTASCLPPVTLDCKQSWHNKRLKGRMKQRRGTGLSEHFPQTLTEVEEKLFAFKWKLFEPNREPLWQSTRIQVGFSFQKPFLSLCFSFPHLHPYRNRSADRGPFTLSVKSIISGYNLCNPIGLLLWSF